MQAKIIENKLNYFPYLKKKKKIQFGGQVCD